MHKKIRKGEYGILLPDVNSLSTSNTPFFNPLLSTNLSFGSLKIPLTVSNNLFKLLMGLINPFSYLTTIGVSMGNNTLTGIGLIGSTLQLGVPNLINNWSKFNNTQKAAGISELAGLSMDTLDNMLFSNKHLNDSALTSGLNGAYDAVSNAAMMFSPVGTIIGGAMKAGKFLGDAIGLGTDQMTKTDLFLDSSFMKLTPIGLVNAFGASKTKKMNINQDTLEKVGSDYGGSVDTINNAYSKSNKKYGLFSLGAKNAANRLIDRATSQLNTMTSISDDYQDLLANISLLAYTRYGMNLNGGYLQLNVRYAKYGASLNRLKHKKSIVLVEDNWQPTILLDVLEYKNGGTIEDTWQPVINIPEFKNGGKTELEESKGEVTSLPNVVPEGALHAHKHHMDNDKNITKKGIPVIDNEGELQAEIECNEIIFNLEVTKKLEELYKKYQESNSQKEKDELAIEAGKLLVNEILHNTIDRTGLIKECKKGGTL